MKSTARQTLRKALRKASQRQTLSSQIPQKVYNAQIQDAANLICAEDCSDFAFSEVCALIEEAQSSPMMDLRALLYVVDKVFKRAERARQSKDPDPLADEMLKKFLPYLKEWIYKYLTCSPRSQSSLDKTRGLVSRWREMGYLSVEQLLPLVELLDAPSRQSHSSQGETQESQSSQSQPRTSEGPVSLSRKRLPEPPAAPAAPPLEPQPTRRRVTPGLPSGASKADATGGTGGTSASQSLEALESDRPKSPNVSKSPNQINQINQMNQVQNDLNSPPQAVAPAPVQTPKDSQRLEIWKVLGDCRCLFRAVVRSRFLDQCNEIPRSSKGEPLEEQSRIKECQYADKLRALLCNLFRQRKAEVAPLLEDPAVKVEDYIQRMEDWRTWGDEICLKFLPDIIQCPIQVYSFNAQQGSFFDAGMYLPSEKAKQRNPCIVLWYNGKSHYDLVSTHWLMAREEALVAEAA